MRTRGFTLLEIMIVIAIMGIIGSLAITTMEAGRGRTAPRNTAADLSGALSLAKNRAMERGSDVWVIIYPNRGTDLTTVGNGAFFVYDDGDVNFGTAGTTQCTGASGSTCNYETFLPPTKINPPGNSATSTDQLLEAQYLDNAPTKNVQFGRASDTSVAWGEPFATTLNAVTAADKDCTFCSGSGVARRGAMVFNGDGAVRFVNATGVTQFVSYGGISIQGVQTKKQVTLFGVAGATGYMGVFQ